MCQADASGAKGGSGARLDAKSTRTGEEEKKRANAVHLADSDGQSENCEVDQVENEGGDDDQEQPP